MYVYRDIDDEQYTYKFSDEEKIKRSNGEKSDDEHQKDYPKHAVKHRPNTTRSNGEKSDDEHQEDYPKCAVKHRLNTTGTLQ